MARWAVREPVEGMEMMKNRVTSLWFESKALGGEGGGAERISSRLGIQVAFDPGPEESWEGI